MYSVVSGSAPLNPSLCIWSPTVSPIRQFREQLDDVLAEYQIPNPFCPLFSDIDSTPQTPETNEIYIQAYTMEMTGVDASTNEKRQKTPN